MIPFGVTIPATVPQRSEIPEGLTLYMLIGQQEPVECPYPEPAVSIPQRPILFLDTIVIITSAMCSAQLLLNLSIHPAASNSAHNCTAHFLQL